MLPRRGSQRQSGAASKNMNDSILAPLADSVGAQICEYIDKKFQEVQGEIKSQLEKTLSDKFETLYRYIDSEIGKVTSRLDKLEQTSSQVAEFDPEKTIVAYHLPYSQTENVRDLAENFIRRGLNKPNIQVVNARRMRTRDDKPGPLKIEVKDKETKIELLRQKSQLPYTEYSDVYARSSKSFQEHIHEVNMKTLLELCDTSGEYFVAGNGKIVKSQQEREYLNRDNRPRLENDRDRSRGSRRGRGQSRGRGRGRADPNGARARSPQPHNRPNDGAHDYRRSSGQNDGAHDYRRSSGQNEGPPDYHRNSSQIPPPYLHSPGPPYGVGLYEDTQISRGGSNDNTYMRNDDNGDFSFELSGRQSF